MQSESLKELRSDIERGAISYEDVDDTSDYNRLMDAVDAENMEEVRYLVEICQVHVAEIVEVEVERLTSAYTLAVDRMNVEILKVLLGACPLDVARHLRDCKYQHTNSIVTTLEMVQYLLEVRGFQDEELLNLFIDGLDFDSANSYLLTYFEFVPLSCRYKIFMEWAETLKEIIPNEIQYPLLLLLCEQFQINHNNYNLGKALKYYQAMAAWWRTYKADGYNSLEETFQPKLVALLESKDRFGLQSWVENHARQYLQDLKDFVFMIPIKDNNSTLQFDCIKTTIEALREMLTDFPWYQSEESSPLVSVQLDRIKTVKDCDKAMETLWDIMHTVRTIEHSLGNK